MACPGWTQHTEVLPSGQDQTYYRFPAKIALAYTLGTEQHISYLLSFLQLG
jgi:hypothetical protein